MGSGDFRYRMRMFAGSLFTKVWGGRVSSCATLCVQFTAGAEYDVKICTRGHDHHWLSVNLIRQAGPNSRLQTEVNFIARRSTLGLGCVETHGDFSSRPGFTPLRRFLADVDRFSGFSACGRFWRAPVPWNGDLCWRWRNFRLNGRLTP